jgi:hypothetical protein
VVGDLLESQVRLARGRGDGGIRATVDANVALADTLALQAPRAAAILRGQTQQVTSQLVGSFV